MFKKIQLLKLKTKITISIVFSAFFLVFLVALSNHFYLSRVLVDNKLEELERINIEQVHESSRIFDEKVLFAKMIATRTRVKEYLSSPTEPRRVELLGILSEYAKEDNDYLSLYLLDKNGIALISTDPTFVGQDYSFREYFKKGIMGEPSVDLLLGKTSNQFGYYFSYPVLGNDKDVLGVFILKTNDKEINDALIKSEIRKESSLMLTDRFGVVLFSDKENRFLKSLGQLTEDQQKEIIREQKFSNREILALQYDGAQKIVNNGEISNVIKINDEKDNDKEVLNVNKIGEYPFYLVTETSLNNIDKTILKILLILIGIVLLGMILTSFILLKLILNSLLPLKQLKSAVEAISFGDFSKKINIESNDGIGDLSKAFNKMSIDLSDLYQNLEKKVNERTKELDESKNNLEKSLEKSEKLNKLMVGRELEMIKLKKEIINLKNK